MSCMTMLVSASSSGKDKLEVSEAVQAVRTSGTLQRRERDMRLHLQHPHPGQGFEYPVLWVLIRPHKQPSGGSSSGPGTGRSALVADRLYEFFTADTDVTGSSKTERKSL